MIHNEYDVIVVGAGHAGNEAAAASANLGANTLLITMNMGVIGQMSCNPAMGGIAKGQIIREIDAIGGYSGIVSDHSAIQFRMLNRSKGPAMWSPRTQNDRMRFAEKWRLMLESTARLDFWQDAVLELIIEDGACVGVKTQLGATIRSKSVVVTAGTFLNGLMHIGEKQFGGGRAGESAIRGITEQLVEEGFTADRMKTGTPPRVDGRSIDYSVLEEQEGDPDPRRFSFTDTPKLDIQRSCHIAYTNSDVHDLLREGFDRSPMFNGRIQGLGPRYCPSIEDKIERFHTKDSHQLFVEPEGWETVEVYVNGFSTSLPEDVQVRALRGVPGFQNVKFFRPGYAVEYDFFHPTQLKHSLETKRIQNLYFAGQINGTTGYEEAAAQGIMAGINAARSTWNKDALVLKRNEAYIGVLIDDLVTKGTKEPYRMFTSRAEYRILLRQDNADQRLTPLSHSIGLASDERMEKLEGKRGKLTAMTKVLNKTSISPQEADTLLKSKASAPLRQKQKAVSLLNRPNITFADLTEHLPVIAQKVDDLGLTLDIQESLEVQIKYAGYIEKEQAIADKLQRLDTIAIPNGFDYHKLESLSSESREKLSESKPNTLSEASRISGVSASDLAVLLVHLGR
ncbi:tRNA uridine-5-carboxymethylaminomethyl(34) synthesis enzyme MnmG [Flavobacteriales bacterium]|nr:tRNA uridine-5-carboxymethylaminomethyl(34) synthesis enzyme MnmG [Flavobacteriales bacterium]MDC0854493.1 tRNA uridine-5-carboxymethylaminomethyl(34) synthesis enzyme MnmG [Flavobacteriales bacterium]